MSDADNRLLADKVRSTMPKPLAGHPNGGGWLHGFHEGWNACLDHLLSIDAEEEMPVAIVWRCNGCGMTYAEYVNGCVNDHAPPRSVVLVAEDDPD
jgi:hypothetical protein